MDMNSNPLFNGNKVKLGVFACNGETPARTLVPERFKLTWENSLDVVQQADRLRFETIVPYARFRSTVSAHHHSALSLENFTFAAAVGANTNHSGVLCTVHVSYVHPVLAAKAMTTIDHITGGRFALNIVCGWFKEESEMFGVPYLDHAERYAQADEWTTVLRKLWTEDDEFDFEGKYLTVKHGMSQPKPLQRPHPPLMNAGASPEGRAFVAKHCDVAFVRSETEEQMRAEAEGYRRAAREHGRELQVWAPCAVILGETQDDALRILDRYGDYADAAYLKSYFERGKWKAGMSDEERKAAMRHYAAHGNGYPLVGSAEHIADQMLRISRSGVDGFLITWVDFQQGIRDFGQRVVPLLEQAGARAPVKLAEPAA